MKRKWCDVCGKHPVRYLTRKDRESRPEGICEHCAPKYRRQGIVSYHGNRGADGD